MDLSTVLLYFVRTGLGKPVTAMPEVKDVLNHAYSITACLGKMLLLLSPGVENKLCATFLV